MRAVNISLPPARRVLDIGCGVGWVLSEAQIQGNPLLVGLDYSLEALHGVEGGPRLLEEGVDREIRFVAGDGQALPFADSSFDVVIGHVSMPYMDTGRALREIHRVLVPGGSIFLTFHSFRFAGMWVRKALRHGSLKELVRCAYIAVNGVLGHLSLPQTQAWWNSRDFETVSTARGVFRSAERAGFILVATEHAPRRIFFAVTARKPDPETGVVLPAPQWAANCRLIAGLGRPGGLSSG
jgi:SAM-dependent methyltransferase